MNTDLFFMYWITFTVLVLVAVAVALVWTWRAGQFSNQDRARYLALWAETTGAKQDEQKEDRNA